MKHTNKLIIMLTAILVVILCLTLIGCQDSENESVSTDANKSDNTLVTTETIVTTKSDTNLETDGFEETSSAQTTEYIEETTVIQETENTESTSMEETSGIQETESETEELYEIKVDDYTLIKNENGCYLTFDDISKYQNNSSSGSSVLGEIIFGSVKEFKDTVTKGLLTDWQKEIVARFENVGDNIQTCDFNNLYEPKLPQGSNAKEVYWNGTAYSYLVMMSDQSFGYVRCYTKEMYDEIFQSKYEDFFNQDTITVTGTEVIDGKEITYYKTSTGVSSYNERYTLTNGNKTVTVDKIFYSSDDTLNRVTLYCTDGSLHYTVTLHKLTEKPTDEWLLQFGLKPYIENNHEVM